ncbi:MAG: DivIVA domain-containing protein, partial [Gemmatimonadaceae bacterium]
EELERLSRANQELDVKARNFHEQLRAFRERDKALNDALISAQQLRGEIREQAQREAQLIIREAQGDAERSLEILRGEIRRAEDDLQNLWRNRRSYVQQLRQLMERQLHDLDSADMVPPPTGIAAPTGDTREALRGDASREVPREMSAPVMREFQTPRDASIPSEFVEAPRAMKQPWATPEPQPPQPTPIPSVRVAPGQMPPVQAAPVQIPPHAPLQHTQTFATPTRAVPPIAPQAVPPLQRPSIPTPSWLDVVEGEGE